MSGVGGRAVVFRLELAAGEQPSDTGADGGEDVRHVGVARWGCHVKGQRRGVQPLHAILGLLADCHAGVVPLDNRALPTTRCL